MDEPEPSIFDLEDAAAAETSRRRGEADAAAGRVIPHEEVAAWLMTWGTPDEKPAPDHWFRD